MENKNPVNQIKKPSKYEGMTTDQILAQALSQTAADINRAKETANPQTIAPEVAYTPDDSMRDINAKLEEIRKIEEVAATIQELAPLPIQRLSKSDISGLVKVTELYDVTSRNTRLFSLNGREVEIQFNVSYDSLVQAVGLAMNLILDSGDNYIFAPNETIIGDLVFLRAVTNINLEFLTLTEVKVTQLIETYDILMPIIKHIAELQNDELQERRRWYQSQLGNSVHNAITYQNSAKGIVDALSAHNIKNQKTMTEQLAEVDSSKLSTIIDFMANHDKK